VPHRLHQRAFVRLLTRGIAVWCGGAHRQALGETDEFGRSISEVMRTRREQRR
jgi:hypothetical protein